MGTTNNIVFAGAVYASLTGGATKRLANAFKVDGEVNPGRKAFFDAMGYAGHSRGAIQSSIDITHLVPEDGIDAIEFQQLMTATLAQQDITVAQTGGGIALFATYAITSNKMGYSTEDGMYTGSLKLEGGKPTVQPFGGVPQA
jgi:hypothetical protein